ncbi:MAG: M67 family metallopeptidase [Proteobacteria bacterium]|nr:M67 family metallopeptidase [Pseudomonadota bacterium]
MTALLLSAAHRAQIEREARNAFPRECCGLLEGARDGDTIRITTLHPARNLSTDSDRFEIDPAGHFTAIRAARADGGEIIGCYHSHPNGKAEPSARDAEGACDEGFLWLIAAVSGDIVSASGFARVSGGWQPLELKEIAENAA